MSEPRPGLQPIVDSAASQDQAGAPAIASESRTGERALEEVVEYVLADCFCAVGQTIGMRITVDYDAVGWWHDHFRAKFLAAMRRHGNRWLQDRETVTGVGWMLAERAVRHALARTRSMSAQRAPAAMSNVRILP